MRYLIIECAQCGNDFKTDRKRKYCDPKCRDKASKSKRPDRHKQDPWHNKTCGYCANNFSTQDNRSRYCSKSCHLRHIHGWTQSKELLPYNPSFVNDMQTLRSLMDESAKRHRVKKRRDSRGPIRKAFEDGDMPALLDALKADSKVTPGGCWEWQRQSSREGYGRVTIGKKWHATHRLAAPIP